MVKLIKPFQWRFIKDNDSLQILWPITFNTTLIGFVSDFFAIEGKDMNHVMGLSIYRSYADVSDCFHYSNNSWMHFTPTFFHLIGIGIA